MSDHTEFHKTCYARTKAGTLMPAMFLGADESGLVTVASPGRTEYTYSSDKILSVEEAEAQIRSGRVFVVASTYNFTCLHVDKAGMIVSCVNPAHPVRSNYTITVRSKGESCSCESYRKSSENGGASTCKHIQAYHILPAGRMKVSPAARPAAHPAPPAAAPRKPVLTVQRGGEW